LDSPAQESILRANGLDGDDRSLVISETTPTLKDVTKKFAERTRELHRCRRTAGDKLYECPPRHGIYSLAENRHLQKS
jgi:hypothetical protein